MVTFILCFFNGARHSANKKHAGYPSEDMGNSVDLRGIDGNFRIR